MSIATMIQKGLRDARGRVQLVLLTHRASERAVRGALAELGSTAEVCSVIRVEGGASEEA